MPLADLPSTKQACGTQSCLQSAILCLFKEGLGLGRCPEVLPRRASTLLTEVFPWMLKLFSFKFILCGFTPEVDLCLPHQGPQRCTSHMVAYGVCTHAVIVVCGCYRTTVLSLLSSSMAIPGIKLRLPCLLASPFTC